MLLISDGCNVVGKTAHRHEEWSALTELRWLVGRGSGFWGVDDVALVVEDKHVFGQHALLLHPRWCNHNLVVVVFDADATPRARNPAVGIEIAAELADELLGGLQGITAARHRGCWYPQFNSQGSWQMQDKQ